MRSEFTNSSISMEFHNRCILVESLDFVIQELWIGHTEKRIEVYRFVVRQVYVRYNVLSRVYDKKIFKPEYNNYDSEHYKLSNQQIDH